MYNNLNQSRVLLINMPCAQVQTPSIQLGILKNSLKDNGIMADIAYFNIRFAFKLGVDLYAKIVSNPSLFFLCEWLFNEQISKDSFKKCSANGDYINYLRENLNKEAIQIGAELGDDPLESVFGSKYLDRITLIREKIIPEFMNDALNRIDFNLYDIIGFSCTFNQTASSLALARLIKNKQSNKLIVIGGASFEGEMGTEYLRAFPYLDVCINGEGEVTLPELVRLFREEGNLGGKSTITLPGISWRNEGKIVTNIARDPLPSIDLSPIPDYDDYFSQIEELQREYSTTLLNIEICFESARGCWWGEKIQCNFCGLNGMQLSYRSKSPERIISELVFLAAKHRHLNFIAVDNVVDKRFYKNLFPKLRNFDYDWTFFYEIRADLTKEQVRLLAEVGVKSVQAGIESFHSEILKFMRKGTNVIQNIQFLKWCKEFNINVTYNFLWGFPQETPLHYNEIASTMEKLMHLPPPAYPPIRMQIERFSPYFSKSADFGISDMQPRQDYQYIYPSDVDLYKIAYIFNGSVDGSPNDLSHIRQVTEKLKVWHDKYHSSVPPHLVYVKGPGFVKVYDSRGIHETVTLKDVAADIYLFCDEIRTLKTINSFIQEKYKSSYTESYIKKIITSLVNKNLVIQERGKILSLAIPLKSVPSLLQS